MKPKHDFVAERRLAQHCQELLPPALPERDLLADYSVLAQDLAAQLAGGMIGTNSGEALSITCSEPVRMKSKAFIKQFARHTAHCMINLPDAGAVLFSVDHGAALALTDRAYGGIGEIPDPLPEALPLSADLTLHHLEAAWSAALGSVLSIEAPPQIMRRGADLGRINPFGTHAECVHIELSLEQGNHAPWTITLSAALPDLRRLVAMYLQVVDEAPSVRVANAPMEVSFGDVPLPARAVLAQMPISLARASALIPGDIIPLAIAREVPLQIGDLTIALGTVGGLDDRVALQITRPFPD